MYQRHLREATVIRMLSTPPPQSPSSMTLPGPRLMSGAEWNKLKRWAMTPGVCLLLLAGLGIAITRPDPEDRHALLTLLLCASLATMVIMVIVMLEKAEDASDARDEERRYRRRSANP